MIWIGKKIVKLRIPIFVVSILLLIPSFIGYVNTRVNYDLLSYLPDRLETVKGQEILMDEFGMGAFSMVIVEDMEPKDARKLKGQIQEVEHVKDVLWYDDITDLTIPVEMLPGKLKDVFCRGDATMMIALFDSTTSSDETMDAVSQLRTLCRKQCFISGMSGVVTDIKDLSLQEMPIYVVIAGLLCLLVLMLSTESFVVPVLFLCSIGMAILYNLGSNLFLGEISYITQALTAVLQLGVTMDYSIFLLHAYEENKVRFDGDRQRAMAYAIADTFKSVCGSSVTTIAGFAALCTMTFTLGKDIGIVMSKGVIIGVVCCVTLLPSMVLLFDGAIEKTRHRSLIPDLHRASEFLIRHYKVWFALFVVLLLPAVYGNQHTQVYYNIDQSLPDDLDSAVANRKLGEEFQMNNVYMVMLKNGLSPGEKEHLMEQLNQVDGIKWVVGMDSLVGASVPESMLPEDLTGMLKSDQYELQFLCSDFKTATDEVNTQIAEVNQIVKSYGQENMVIGEAPLTKDLADVTDRDLQHVNLVSIGAIFLIILAVFKSLSIPVLLVSVIEFAIFVNMGIPYYGGTQLPFVASIVIGTIQLGATVDYAILMTSLYQKARQQGSDKREAIAKAHTSSMKSILTSGLSFFAATFGVGLYSRIDMISSICNLLSIGAIISTIVVLCILPSMFFMFDGVICKTSIGFQPKKDKK